MKKKMVMFILLLSLIGCVGNIPKAMDENPKQKLSIDLDKELKDKTGLRDGNSNVFSEPIYIGDNDEVSFKGNIIQKNSPLIITIGKKKPIHFNGKAINIKTAELKNGETITIEGKDGTILVDISVLR